MVQPYHCGDHSGKRDLDGGESLATECRHRAQAARDPAPGLGTSPGSGSCRHLHPDLRGRTCSAAPSRLPFAEGWLSPCIGSPQRVRVRKTALEARRPAQGRMHGTSTEYKADTEIQRELPARLLRGGLRHRPNRRARPGKEAATDDGSGSSPARKREFLFRMRIWRPGRISWPDSPAACAARVCRSGRTPFPIPGKCCKARASET